LHRSPGAAARIAAQDLTGILGLVAGKLALAGPPAVPLPAGVEPEGQRSAARLRELRARFR
jgi:hypothetical protein